MDIPQPALAFFDFGFEQIDRTAVLGVARAVFLELLANEALDAGFDKAGLHLLLELLKKREVAAQKARVEQGRAHPHVAFGRRMQSAMLRVAWPGFYAGIPQRVLQFFRHGLDERRNSARVKKQQIDVRVRVQFAAAVTALRDQAQSCGRYP